MKKGSVPAGADPFVLIVHEMYAMKFIRDSFFKNLQLAVGT
jgi:hypothetical protein